MPRRDLSLNIWTVETWSVRPEKEAHFLKHCGALNPGRMTLFRDLEKSGFFWSPAKWESRDALNKWRMSRHYNAGLSVVAEDVLEHTTHFMESVPEFAPK